MPRPSCSAVLDHWGLVAGLCADLGIGDVMDQATPQHPEPRFVTVGHAVQARGRNGRGFVHPHLSLVPRGVHHPLTQRLVAPGIDAAPRTEEALGRALETRSASGVPALSRLLAATA